MRAFLIAALLLAFAMPARAQEWTRTYGGRGEDQLTEMIPLGEGLLAVGRTFSADGDLEKRTRSGETGWAIRLDAQGEPLWSLSTAHVGRATVSHPFLHADGTLSCALGGEDAGFEWLRINPADGRITARIEFPRGAVLCEHDAHAAVRDVFPCEIDGSPTLAVWNAHADGTACFAAMDEAGNIAPGASIRVGESALVRQEPNGGVVMLGVEDGAARIAWIVPGSQSAPFSVAAGRADASIEQLFDAFAAEDGSVTFSGRLSGGGGFLQRVSAGGETIFFVRVSEAEHIAPTSTGFAALTGSDWMFYDEEGALLGIRRGDGTEAAVKDAAPLGGGVATLQYLAGSAQKQARVAAIEGYTDAGGLLFDGALYARPDSRMLAARAVPEGALMLAQSESGETACLLVLPSGEVREDARTLPSATGEQALNEGTVRWQEEPGGALVTRLDESGTIIWQTRTPIHTAADRLVWRCAADTPDGGVLLGGCYVTGEGEEAESEAVVAMLGEDGVLREFQMPDGEAVCAELVEAGGTRLALMNGGAVDAVFSLESGEKTALGMAYADGCVVLIRAPDGALWAAGTAVRGGRSAAAVQVVR